MKSLHQQSGMVIILAILIMSAVLATAVLFSNLIIREIQQSRLIDQSIQAYYYAESGSERALHQVRQRSGVRDCNLLGSGATCQANSRCSSPFNNVPCVNTTGGVLGPWNLTAEPEPETSITLSRGSTFQVDLFDPAQINNSSIDQIGIVNFDPSLRLLGELTNLTKILGVAGSGVCLDQPATLKGFISGPPSFINGLDGETIWDQCSYIFKLNYPLNTGVPQGSTPVTIQLFDKSTGTKLPIPSRLIINSDAIFGDSFQSVTVSTPVRPPLSGLYDFVLFSEADIIKN